jgi:hypothetical protein
MPLLQKSVKIFDQKGMIIGEFDMTVDGFYRNVLTFSFDVKKQRQLYLNISSKDPIDVAVSNSNGSIAAHKKGVTEDRFGPVFTRDNKEMGLFLGVMPGDKTVADVEIWMERK